MHQTKTCVPPDVCSGSVPGSSSCAVPSFCFSSGRTSGWWLEMTSTSSTGEFYGCLWKMFDELVRVRSQPLHVLHSRSVYNRSGEWRDETIPILASTTVGFSYITFLMVPVMFRPRDHQQALVSLSKM